MVGLALVWGSAGASAAEALPQDLGAQVFSSVPTSPDLKLATGGPGLGVGLHWDVKCPGALVARLRMDAQVFPAGHQRIMAQGFDQRIDTRTSSLGAGADLLLPVPVLGSRLSVGVGAQRVRWKVDARNALTATSGATSTVEGPASWWRLAYGPVMGLQITKHLGFEGRMTFSHHGMESQPARCVAVGLLWHF